MILEKNLFSQLLHINCSSVIQAFNMSSFQRQDLQYCDNPLSFWYCWNCSSIKRPSGIAWIIFCSQVMVKLDSSPDYFSSFLPEGGLGDLGSPFPGLSFLLPVDGADLMLRVLWKLRLPMFVIELQVLSWYNCVFQCGQLQTPHLPLDQLVQSPNKGKQALLVQLT